MRAFKDQHGVALPLSLFVLVALVIALLVFVSMSGTEPQVASNLSDTTRARYVADGGIEWAYDQLLLQWVAPGVNTLLATNTGTMATNMTLPGLPAANGTFTVTVRNDNLPNDNLITGQPVDVGGPTNDTNNVVILTSTGTYNGITRQIQLVVTHLDMNIPGALNLPGVGTNTVFSDDSFIVSGNDTNLDDTPGAGTPGCPASVWGVSVANAAIETLVQNSLNAERKQHIVGNKQNPALPGVGDNTIAPDASLTPAMIANFVAAVKPYADITLNASATNRLVYQNIGNTCSSNLNDANCWGTHANPKIVYIKGTLDPAQAFYALTVGGTSSTGAGILIVEDGDVSLSGYLHWEGLIVITGQYVGLRYTGERPNIYGGVIVNETANANSEVEFQANANLGIHHSCQALDNVRNARRMFRASSWREL